MNNELVDLKLNNTDEGTKENTQSETKASEYIEGSYRYDALTDADVNNIEFDSRPTLITLLGFSESGKTTFVGSLFAILRRRPDLLNTKFIDSDTLTGFERRIHQRLLSKDGKSVTPRTQRKSSSILNVVLHNKNDNNQHMFVISDLSGEIYEDAISDKTAVLQQKAVKYADKLVIFVDGEQLLKAMSYGLYKDKFQSLLKRFRENDMFPDGSEVYVAINKIDLVKNEINREKEETKSAIENRKNVIVNIVKDYISIMDDNIFEICSLNIQKGNEDEQLIQFLTKLLCKKKQESLPSTYNWIKNLSKKQ